MELAILVYAVDLIMKVSIWLWVGFGISVALPCLTWLDHMMYPSDIRAAKDSFKRWFNIKLVLPLFVIALLIPSQQTMKYIGAAYLVQTTFESEFVQESITLSQKAVIKQLQTWSEDDADIKSLLNSVDIPLTKNDKSEKEKINEE